jgi:hypothetical protein
MLKDRTAFANRRWSQLRILSVWLENLHLYKIGEPHEADHCKGLVRFYCRPSNSGQRSDIAEKIQEILSSALFVDGVVDREAHRVFW